MASMRMKTDKKAGEGESLLLPFSAGESSRGSDVPVRSGETTNSENRVHVWESGRKLCCRQKSGSPAS